MRAIVHDTFGDPAEVLRVEERPVPEPGRGEVRLRAILASIHNHDLWTIRGEYGFKTELPGAASGTEIVGVVDALGEGVSGLSVGQRVVSASTFGVWAEYSVVPAAAVVPVPDAIADDAAAQLISMPFSALTLLDFLGARPGQWIVQNSAGGAVGRMVAQLARARGIEVLGLVRRGAAVEQLRAGGIENVVSTDAADWQEQARALIGGGEVPVAVDSVAGSAAGDLLSLVDDGGTLVSFGALGGSTLDIPVNAIIFRDITVKGFWGKVVSQKMAPAKRAELFAELMERVVSGQLELTASATFDIAQIAEAARASVAPGRVGKVLLRF